MQISSRWNLNLNLVLPYLLCAVISCAMLGSIAPDKFWAQLGFFICGFFLLIYLSSQHYSLYQTVASRSYQLAIILLVITMVIGEAVRGSTRWIPLGSFNLQTSEIAKPLLILAFAYYLEKYPPQNLLNILRHLFLFLVPFLLIYLQPDLGTALVIAAIFFLELFLAGLPIRYILLALALFGVGLSSVSYLLKPYQLERLETFLDPYQDPLGSGYNVIQSNIAIGSGGIMGKGLGHGTQSQLRFLPERHTDFMFASLSEELGGIGAIAALGLLVYFISKALGLALVFHHSRRLVAGGIFAYLFFQTFINVGMNLGLAPVTGITLPLISYGGSSLLGATLTLGILGSLLMSFPTKSPSLEIR